MEPNTLVKGGTGAAQQPQQQLLQQDPSTATPPAGGSGARNPGTTTPARPAGPDANDGAGAKPAAATLEQSGQQQPSGLTAAAAAPAETGGSKPGLPVSATATVGVGTTAPGAGRKEANPTPTAQLLGKQKGNGTEAAATRTAAATKSAPGAAQPAKAGLQGLVGVHYHVAAEGVQVRLTGDA